MLIFFSTKKFQQFLVDFQIYTNKGKDQWLKLIPISSHRNNPNDVNEFILFELLNRHF